MPGTIFYEMLRRHWRQSIYWGIGIASLSFYTLIALPNVDALQQYSQLLETLPPVLLQAFGASDVAALASAEGFLGFGLFLYAFILLAIYGVLAGLNITANDEDAGIMDVVLATPVARWRIIVEKFAAYAVFVTLIALMCFGGMLASGPLTEIEIDLGRLFMGSLNIIPATLFVIALTAFCGAVFTRRSQAVTAATSILVGMYFIFFIGNAASDTLAANLRLLSVFWYYDAEGTIIRGVSLANVSILVVTAFSLLWAGVAAWERRDVGV